MQHVHVHYMHLYLHIHVLIHSYNMNIYIHVYISVHIYIMHSACAHTSHTLIQSIHSDIYHIYLYTGNHVTHVVVHI